MRLSIIQKTLTDFPAAVFKIDKKYILGFKIDFLKT